MIPLEDLAQRTRLLTREQFLAEVTVPHLFLAAMPETEEVPGAKFSTTEFSSLLLELEGKPVLFPLRKRDTNAFASMITVGRARNNDVNLSHPGVSKFHAYFSQIGETWSVRDASSSFGVYVDGVRLAPDTAHPVASGARVRVAANPSGGGLEFEFLSPEALYERALAAS